QKISLRNSRFVYRDEIYEPVEYGVNGTDVDCRELNVDVTGLDFSASPMKMEVVGLGLVEKSGLVVKNMSGKVQITADNLLITGCHFELERSIIDLVKLEYNWIPNQHDWKYFTSRMQQYYELGPSSVSFIDLAYFNGVLRGITNTVKCSGIVSNTVGQLEGHDLYFELGDKSVFQANFKSVGLPDVWNTVFSIELTKAHFGPEDLASVYLPWFGMNIPVPEPLYKLPSIDFNRIRFDGTFLDFLVHAESVTPALSGDLNFIYGTCKDSLSDCADIRGNFDFNRINFRKLTGLPMLGIGAWKGNYSGIWNGSGSELHGNSVLRHLNVNRATLHDISVDMVMENGRLDLLASVDDKLVGGGCVLTCDLNDTLSFFSAKGQLNLHDLGNLGMGVKGGAETAGLVFDLVHAGQSERSFSNLTLTDLQYANENGAFSIERLCLEDSRYRDYNTTTLQSDIFDLSIEGTFRDIRPVSFVWGLVQNYLPAYSVRKKKSFVKKKLNLRQFDFEYGIRIKDANRILSVLYPGLSISPDSRVTSFFRPGDDKLNLLVAADTIRYNDLMLLNTKINMTGDPDQLKLNCFADKLEYGNGYRLFNLRNELALEDNRLDNRLCWCNWEASTYSGELAASVVFRPDEKNVYSTEIKLHPGVIVMDDSVWHVDSSTIRLQGKELSV
ncbi:MAG: hypothetical protein K2L23_09835, partial [Odoribacter sp.]|nr:hypothetical protein [Odoribacter sp.]